MIRSNDIVYGLHPLPAHILDERQNDQGMKNAHIFYEVDFSKASDSHAIPENNEDQGINPFLRINLHTDVLQIWSLGFSMVFMHS